MEELKKYRILLVEDDLKVADNFARLLNMIFKTVQRAPNGLEALEIIKKDNDIDLIITDLRMPEMDGIQLIKEVKKLNKQLPIVVTTAYTNQEIMQETKSLGVDEYMLKPLDAQVLINRCVEIFKIL